ncbi:MAG: hemolysin family protein [Solirubrobacteraceae bacterium]
MIELLLILVALALVAACGAFVAAEFSLITVDRSSVQQAADGGDAKAKGVLRALKSLSTQLSAAQVGITATNLLIGFLAEPSIADLIRGPLESGGVPGDAVDGVALVIALVLATGVTMLFGELVPKNLAIARPLATARAVQGFQRGFTVAAGPIVRSFNGAANALLRRMGIEPQEELASARSPDELVSLVRRSAEQGTLAASTATLLQRSLAFGERHAGDVMTPRERMESVAPDDSIRELLERARQTGRSRFPVVDAERFDAVLGIAHIKDAVRFPHQQRGGVRVAEIMSAPLHVPTTAGLDALLGRLREGGLQMAVVVNEYGGVDGLVTLEDLVEEIVGEVRDEHDGPDDAVTEESGGWSVSGLLRPDEVERRTGIAVPEDEDYETIAGLVARELGRLPVRGDEVPHDRRSARRGLARRRPHRARPGWPAG